MSIYHARSAAAARRQLKALGTWLETNGHVDATASLREVLDETLTVLTLEAAAAAAVFREHHCIENLIGTVRRVTRNVTRWRDGTMIRRLGRLGARAGGDALPPDQRPSRVRHAGDGAEQGRGIGGRGMSRSAILSRSDPTARAQDGPGAILRRGPLRWYPPSGGLSALTPIGCSARSYNVRPPRSAKFNGARDNPFLLSVHGR
jgi:hypothetical protein